MSKKMILDIDDDMLKIFIDEEEIFSTNHDEVGWDGIDALEKYSKALAVKLGLKLIEK